MKQQRSDTQRFIPAATACRLLQQAHKLIVLDLFGVIRLERDVIDCALFEIAALDVSLQTANRDLFESLRVELRPARKAAGVDHFEQCSKRFRIAVMWRCREKQAMLAMLGELPYGDGPLGVHGVTTNAPPRVIGAAGATWCASSTTSTSKAKSRTDSEVSPS